MAGVHSCSPVAPQRKVFVGTTVLLMEVEPEVEPATIPVPTFI